MKQIFKQKAGLMLTAITMLLAMSSFTFAQETTGTIVGTVRDSSGAAVPGATVTISDAQKKDVVVRTLTTNDDGEFNAPNLAVGIYVITVEASNFKKSVNTDVKLDVGQRRTVDVTLQAGRIEETVTVEADPVAVELSTPAVGTVISGDLVRDIPINNRNFTQLVALAPGVSSDLSDQVYVGTVNPEGQANTVQLSVNGARSSQNTFTVDGADITDRGSNLTIQAYPSVDSIGEFRILRSLYPAESGRSGGGQVNVITRSGGEEFHGSAFEFIRNEAFNANDFLSNQTAPVGRTAEGKAKRRPFRYNNYGWTFSGPVYFLNVGDGGEGGLFKRYKRTYFFFSQEFRKDKRFPTFISSVPDASLRNGVFPIDVCINRPALGETSCTGAFRLAAGSPIPASFLSPAAQAYLTNIYNKLPLPNAPTPTNPYQLVAPSFNNADFRQEIFKFDHTFSDKWSAFYRFQNDKIPTVDANALFSSGSGLPGVSTTSTNSPGRTHTIQTTYALSPNRILEGRYTYAYGAILSENVGLLSLKNGTVPITLPFVNERDRVPTISGNGFTALQSFGPYDNFSDKHNYNLSYTWIFGSHSTKYGIAYSLYRKNENALAGNNEGIFNSFSATLPTGVTASTLNQNLQRWANFLVGNVASFTQASFDYTADLRQKTFEAYAQDEFRARSNLTLYYGVRYSFFGAPWDKNGRLTNFVPEFYNPASAPLVTGAGNRIAGTGNFCNGLIANTQNFQTATNCTPAQSPFGKFIMDAPKNDFAPRIGLAWDPFGKGKTAIRTGYGIYHEQVLNGTLLQIIGLNPPYQQNLTITNTRLDNPLIGTVAAASLGVNSLRAIQADWKTPYMQHWSLDLQQQLATNTIFTIGYYGSKGTNLIGLTELNDLPAGLALNSQCAPGNNYIGQPGGVTTVRCQPAGYAFRGVATATGNPNVVGTTTFTDALILEQLRPYRGFRSIAIIQPRYSSNYHSMQVSARQRFSDGSEINLAYTWAKNLTNSPNDRTTAPQDSYNIDLEWQRAALDRRHVFNVNYSYYLPFFSKQEGFIGKVLGGWQASGIVSYNTGIPFSVVTSSYDPAGLGFLLANPSGRPNVLCDPNKNAPRTQQQYFNTACFELNPANTASGLPNTVGNASRGIINGPRWFKVDFALTKNIRFGERYNLMLRGEAFNIFNTTNFRTFTSLNVTSTAFGQIGGVRDPRTMQFGAKFSF